MIPLASDLDDFPDLLQATAQSRGIPAAIVEKDYDLTRALRALAEAHAGDFVLKGGTGLSKGWQLLDRFSEDIDLLLRCAPGWGKARRDTRLKSLARAVAACAGFDPGTRLEGSTGVHRTVGFQYRTVTGDLDRLSKTVLLEMGYRGQPDACVSRPVRSLVSEFAASGGHADLAQDLTGFDLEMQSLEWTFVEKLFAAHAAFSKDRAHAGARHYYDLYRLSTRDEVRRFVGSEGCRECVGEVRRIAQEAFPGQALPESLADSPAFQPDADGLRELDRNYRADAHLFFIPPPPLSEILPAIRALLLSL